MEDHGYKSINDISKVWYLISGVKYDALNSVKTVVLAPTTYCQYFDARVPLYKDYIQQAQYTEVELNISGVGTEAGK